ncbi:MAG TPA: hypothetical protein VF532_00880 [Candidatus Angelobacter sp.]
MPIPGHIAILEPWEQLSKDRAVAIDSELQRELSPEHVLYGVEATAVAISSARDDVLFELRGHEFPLAHVHLTWSQRQLDNPHYPKTQFFSSWQDWVQEKLIPDHDEYNLS